MPKLDELRRWARGEAVKGLPEPVQREPVPEIPQLSVDPDSETVGVVRAFRHGKYKMSQDGNDVLLQFGIFTGHKASELVQTSRGRKYLRWVLDARQQFNDDFKAACRHQLEHHKSG